MIDTIVKIICAIMCGFTITYTVRSILYKECEIVDRKTILLSSSISLITYLLYNINYSVESMIIRIVFCTILIKFILNESVYKTLIAMIITFVIMSLGEIISSSIFLNKYTMVEIRQIWYCILMCNLIVCIFPIAFITIPIIRQKLHKFVYNIKEKGKASTFFIFIISSIVLAYAFYNISKNYNISDKYYINIIIIITYFLIIIIFLKDKIEYNNLCMKYDCLFDYFKDVEDNLDDVSLTNHEYKNQLAVIKGYIENNKQGEAIKYINDIVNDNSEVDSNIISELKNIPKGGIKGLLYYKIITAHSRNVTPVLNISNDSKKYLKKLTSEENRVISKVLGVYIDNAIESASLLDKKFITIEIYSLGNIINFVISNQFKPEISDITRVSEKGYSTKGKGHGKGTYLINKIIKKTNWVHTERKIIKNFYIQKISVIK